MFLLLEAIVQNPLEKSIIIFLASNQIKLLGDVSLSVESVEIYNFWICSC